MDLIHVLHGDRYWFKIIYGTFPVPGQDLKVKVTDLEFLARLYEVQGELL